MYVDLSRVTYKNDFKIFLSEDLVFTEHKKYKADFLRTNVNDMPNVYTKNIVYEKIFYNI